jgi:replication factor A1
MSGFPPLRRATYVKVADLDPNERGANVVADVINVEVVCANKRPDGTSVRVAEVLIGDETGCVVLTARNDQIEKLRKCRTVVLRNTKVDMFQSFMRLSVDKWGKISAHPDGIASTPPAPAFVNREHNLSQVEYEQVDPEA